MKLEFFLGLRYFLAKKQRSSVSHISTISITCVALAVAVIIIVLSIVNGMHASMKSKILACDSHVVIGGGVSVINDYRKVVAKVGTIPGVSLASPFYEGMGLVSYGGRKYGTKIRGVEKDILKKDKELAQKMKMKKHMGVFDLSKRNNIVIGEQLARSLGVYVGARVSLFVSSSQDGGDFLLPLNLEYRVVGIFTTGYSQYDERFIFMSLSDAQLLFGVKDVAYAVGVKLDNHNAAASFKKKIRRKLRSHYPVQTWMQLNVNLYHALATEKVLLSLVLFFVFLMAAFPIAGTLIMVVMEKEQEIGILKTIGLTPVSVNRVFLTQGFVVGMAGTLIGLFFGLLISTFVSDILSLIESLVNFFQQAYYSVFKGLFDLPYPVKWKLFPQNVYYISSFEAVIQPIEVFFISLGAVMLTTMFAIIPAKLAVKLKVTEVLHKE